MKFLVFLLCASVAIASQSDPTRGELLQTIQHIQRLAKEQQKELDEGHGHEQSLERELKGAQDELGTTQNSLVSLQVDINNLAAHDAKETADKTHILTKYHRLKAIACSIAAAAAVFGVMQLTSFIPMAIAPYKIYLYAGAGIGAATLVATML
jgi:septal ring factor EnvC (AmiA/AmiB activator)